MFKKITIGLLILLMSSSVFAQFDEDSIMVLTSNGLDRFRDDPFRITDESMYNLKFGSYCNIIQKRLKLINDNKNLDAMVQELIAYPITHYEIKASIVQCLTWAMARNTDAYDYVFNALLDQNKSVRLSAARAFILNNDYAQVDDIVIQDEAFDLLVGYNVSQSVKDIQKAFSGLSVEGQVQAAYALSYFGQTGIKETTCENVLNTSGLNTDDSINRAKYVAIRYLTKLERDDMISRIAYFAEDRCLAVKILAVDMLNVFRELGYSTAATELLSISTSSSDPTLRETAKSYLD